MDRLLDRSGTKLSDTAEAPEDRRHLSLVSGIACMHERALQDRLHLAEPQAHPPHIGHLQPRVRQPGLVLRRLEHLDRSIRLGKRILEVEVGIDEHAHRHPFEPCPLCQRLIAGLFGRLDGRAEHALRLPQVTALPERDPEVDDHGDVRRFTFLEKRRGPLEQIDGRGHVAARERSPARGRQPAAATERNRPCPLVDATELHPVVERPLEVVSEQLLVLARAGAGHVYEPVREALVQLRAQLLRNRIVRRLTDQSVPEAKAVLCRRRPPCRDG